MIDSSRRLEYLRAMGVDVWVRRDMPHSVAHLETVQSESAHPESAHPEPVEGVEGVKRAEGQPTASLDWPALKAAVKSCTQCDLHRTRTHTVFGVGDSQARWMVIGEAPGVNEDQQGEPFVGPAGQLLNAMLKAMGLAREQVFIANAMKCRPPGDRDPTPAEAACCKPFLLRQIELVNPDLILCLGRIAAQTVLNSSAPLTALRGQVHRLGEAQRPVVVTYHPAYLLRTPGEKRRAWEDLQLAMLTMEKTVGCPSANSG